MALPYSEEEHLYKGDVFKWFAERRYNFAMLAIKANAGATEGIEVGQVMEDDTGEILIATEANADAIVAEPVSLAEAIAGCNKLCMVRGPALVSAAKLGINGQTLSTILTALAALGIIAEQATEPTWTKQTT